MLSPIHLAHESVSPAMLCRLIEHYAVASGVKYHPSSRLGVLLELCRSAQDFNSVQHKMKDSRRVPRGDDLAVLWIQSELNEFATILSYPPKIGIEKWRMKVEETACGPLFPADERNNKLPRSTQSELLTFACMQRSGYSPVFEEPDLVGLSNKTGEFAVAVKRLRSLKKARDRFGGAFDQVRRAGRKGVVVLDVVSDPPRSGPSIARAANDAAITVAAREEVNSIARKIISEHKPDWYGQYPGVLACYVFRKSYWLNEEVGRFLVANHMCYCEFQNISAELRESFVRELEMMRALTPKMLVELRSSK